MESVVKVVSVVETVVDVGAVGKGSGVTVIFFNQTTSFDKHVNRLYVI